MADFWALQTQSSNGFQYYFFAVSDRSRPSKHDAANRVSKFETVQISGLVKNWYFCVQDGFSSSFSSSGSYDNQSLQLFSGSIHRRPIKFGMLVYHIIAQGQFLYFFEIRNIFRKIAFFRIFWDLVNFTAYRHQFITIYSYTIHLRSIKLGMLVYHIIAQGQIYWFFGNSNYFSKKIVFSGFLGLSQFHLIPASVTPTFLRFYSS